MYSMKRRETGEKDVYRAAHIWLSHKKSSINIYTDRLESVFGRRKGTH